MDVNDSVSNTELELLQLQMKLNEEKILQETAGSYPSLDFFMAFEWLQQEGMGDLFSSGSTWFNQHMIGLQLSIPLLNPDNRKSKIQENRINQEMLSVQQDLLQEKIRMERATARRDVQLSRERLELSERKVTVYERQFHQETIRYEQEFSTLKETLEAEEQLRRSQMEMSQRKMDYFLSILELYRSYGNLESFNKMK
jgi:outer membrane protein TolC